MGLLPTKPSIPKQNLSQYQKLLFGEAGVGKTSFAAAEPNTVMILFEDGTAGINAYTVNVVKEARKQKRMVWEVYLDVVEEILEGDHGFKNIAIDSADRANEFARKYVCKVNDWDDVQDGAYGAGWRELNDTFQEPIKRIQMSDYGLTIISHAKFKEVEDVKGNKRDKIIPSVTGSSGEWLIDESDIIIFYDRDIEGNRVMRVESDKNFEAKSRIKFENGVIDAGNSAKEAYKNFKKEFDKAIDNLNDKLGITQKMIDEYHTEKEKEQKLSDVRDKIKGVAKKKGLNGVKNAKIMKETVGVDSIHELDLDMAKKYLDYLKNEYDG